ncbi:MAG: NAD(P)-dependent dehydrogenase (short-subunit alcohol dehydrogenase family) [Planctomycetota bacterium]|jgi:NAD(P)-dependent dehydrogenase (short-subunit alcohol dehydrogenase family)
MQDLATCNPFIILGATGATGQQLARDLHERGAKLRLLARDETKLNELADSLNAERTVLAGADAISIRDAMLAACADGPAAGVAHCIGSLLLKPAKRTTAEEWHEVIETNLSSAFGVTMAAVDCMKGGGSVVFCSSVAASLGLPNHEAIAAAKAGLIGLARAAAASHLRRNIRFHCVAPALVDSQMTAQLLGRTGMREAAAKQNPSGRIGRPDDVSRAIAFLLDPKNDWIDGQILEVDGGFGSLRGLG